MSLYERAGSPYWWYSFTVNGRRFRRSTGCEGKREAKAVEAEEHAKATRSRTATAPWRIRDCFGAYWLEHGKHQRSADFIWTKLEKLSDGLGRDTLIGALTNAMMMDYRAKRRREDDVQAHSVNRDFNIAKAALNHAAVMHGQLVPALAWKRIKVNEPPHRVRFLSREEYAALLGVCDEALGRLVRFAVATGLRKANILALDWSAVDLSASLITVVIKGDKRHSVRLTGQVRAMLARETDRTGQVFDTCNFRKRWDKAVADAGLADFRFHDLRHTFASWARIAGADLSDICDALGHSSVAVTMRYAHIEASSHETAFDRVAGAVWSQNRSQRSRKPKRINGL